MLREKYATPNAHIMIEVPNANSRSAWATYHFVVFTPDTLEQTLLRAGWEGKNGRILGGNGNLIQLVGEVYDEGNYGNTS
jgi:hypothetical protein